MSYMYNINYTNNNNKMLQKTRFIIKTILIKYYNTQNINIIHLYT